MMAHSANVLPPPDDLAIPMERLLNHQTYRAYQAACAALSLTPRTYLRLQPPSWGAAPPPTPRFPGTTSSTTSGSSPANEKEKKEWKRRIKMYLGPAIEAFGVERLVFGSAPAGGHGVAPADEAQRAGDWFELAREALAELALEQDAIDAIFSGNARVVYGAQ